MFDKSEQPVHQAYARDTGNPPANGSQITRPGHPTQQMFHAVSPMIKKEGYLVQYLLQHSTEALTTLGQIPALVPGMHVGLPQNSHHKIVTATDKDRLTSGRPPPPMQR